MLVLNQDDLRVRQVETLSRILSFLDLPPLAPDAVPQMSQTNVEKRMEELFPSFGMTGWLADGKYAPMSDSSERALRKFFRPYNAALYEYLGVDFGWDSASALER